jgi:hypothetical protein
MSETTSRGTQSFLSGDVESVHEYSDAGRDLSVPEPVAERTGLSDLTATHCFDHRGHDFDPRSAVRRVENQIFYRYAPHSSSPDETKALIEVVGVALDTLTELYPAWFTRTEAFAAHSWTEEFIDEDAVIFGLPALLGEDVGLTTAVPFNAGVHRRLTTAVIALVLAQAGDHREADTDAQTAAARVDLQQAVVAAAGDLSEDKAVAAVREVYDKLGE